MVESMGKDGREYLLKEGSVVQLSIEASHAFREYWGDDVDEFNPTGSLTRRAKMEVVVMDPAAPGPSVRLSRRLAAAPISAEGESLPLPS